MEYLLYRKKQVRFKNLFIVTTNKQRGLSKIKHTLLLSLFALILQQNIQKENLNLKLVTNKLKLKY